MEVHGGAVAGQAQGTDDERCFSFIPPVINSWPGVGGAGHLLYSVGLSASAASPFTHTAAACILYFVFVPSVVSLPVSRPSLSVRLWTRRGSADRPRADGPPHFPN